MTDLIKRFKQGIDKGVAVVSVKSSTVLETNKIRVHIRTLTDKIEQSKKDLGEMVFAMYLKQEFDQEAYANACEVIIQLDEQCKAEEQVIERLREQETEILGKDNKVKACECGEPIEEGMKFCVACGKKI